MLKVLEKYRPILEVASLLGRRSQIKLALLTIAQMFISILDLLGVILIGLLVSLVTLTVTNVEAGGATATLTKILQLETANESSRFAVLGIIAAAFFVSKSLMSLYLQRLTIFFVADKSSLLADNMVRKLLNLPLNHFRKYSGSELNYIFSTGIQKIMQGLISRPIFALSDVFLVLALSMGIFLADPLLAFSVLVYFGLLAGALYKFQHNHMRNLGLAMRDLHIENLAQIQEIVKSFKVVSISGLQDRYAKKIKENRISLTRASAIANLSSSIGKYVIEVASVIGVVGVAIGLFATRAPSTAAALVALFVSASFRIGPAALRLQSFFVTMEVDLESARPALEMIRDLKRKKAIQKKPNNIVRNYKLDDWTICFDKVNFGYDNTSEILEDFNLTIKMGEHVAIVGPSGSGKTTLLDLLLGLIKPSNGLISIGSLNPTEFISEFPGAIAYVSQDHTLSAGTLRSCILGPYTPEEVTDSEIVETLKKVSMHSLVRDLKDGLDHKIKDDGNNLSGGQIQRISIARALITKPKILVLDEATSNLDQGTQREIVEELSNLKGTCTVIVVAHRLEVLEHMDRILVLGSQEPPNAIKRKSQSV